MPSLHDMEVRRQVYLEQWKAGLARDLNPYVDRIQQAVVGVLRDLPVENMSEVRLQQLVQRINTAQGPLWAELRQFLLTQYEALAEDESEFEAKALEKGTPAEEIAAVAGAAILLAAMGRVLSATGETLEATIDGYIRSQQRKILQVVRTGAAKGATVSETIRDLTGTKYRRFKDGLFHKIQNTTDAVSGTGAQHVVSTATVETWKRNARKLMNVLGAEAKAVVDGKPTLKYKWISVLDARTTQVCRSLSGRVFILGRGPLPGIHWNCRSTIRMYDGTEDPQYQSYYSWLAEQPAEFQDDAIGPKRAQLFREGGLTPEQFARLNLGRSFQPLTLKEMKAKRPNVFQESGVKV